MRFFLAMMLGIAAPALAYTDGEGRYHDDEEGYDIFVEGGKAPETVGITSYGSYRDVIIDEGNHASGSGSIYGMCVSKWKNDYEMQEYCISQQEGARNRVRSGTVKPAE